MRYLLTLILALVPLSLSSTPAEAYCCKTCTKGKACGDSCIAWDKDCTKGPGCACDGYAAPETVLYTPFDPLADRPGVQSIGGDCPTSHPIKGNFTTYDGSKCIAHTPGGRSYARTNPERCYATMADAVADGCRPAKR